MHIKKLKAKDRPTNPPRAYTGRIDRRLRVALPPQLQWRVGTRVYFNPTKDGGIQIGKVPARLYQGRLFSSRIQRMHQPIGCYKDRDGRGIRALHP